MLQFNNFLTEAKKQTGKTAIAVGSKGARMGVLHELLVGYYIRGGKGDPRSSRNAKFHMEQFEDSDNISPLEAFGIVIDGLDPDLLEQEIKRAQFTAKEMVDYWAERGYHITGCRWTSKPNDTEKVTGVPASQKQDDSDIYFDTKEGISIGTSLKASEKSVSVPTSHPGIAATFGGEKYNEAYRKWLRQRFPQLEKLTNKKERQAWLASHPRIATEIKAKQDETLTKIRNNLLSQLKKMTPNQAINYLRFTIIHAYQTPAEKAGKSFHVRWSTAGTKSFRTKIVYPGDDYEAIFQAIRDHPEKLKWVVAGATMIGAEYDGQRFASQHIKWLDGTDPTSQVKGSGNDVGSAELNKKLKSEAEEVVKPERRKPDIREPKTQSLDAAGGVSFHTNAERATWPHLEPTPEPSPEEKPSLAAAASQKKAPNVRRDAAQPQAKKLQPERKVNIPNVKTSVPKSRIRAAVKSVFQRNRQQPNKTPRPKIPWDRIQEPYTRGEISVSDISKQFNVNTNTVYSGASSRGWKRGASV